MYEKTLVPLFKPTPDFAAQWARLAKKSGAKYVVFTCKHHDGFSLHESARTTYDAKDVTGRDLAGEIIDAIREEGLGVGVFYSLWDWHHPDAPAGKGAINIKGTSMAGRSLSRYVDYFHSQVNEITDGRYGDIDILWLDFSRPGYEGEAWGARELVSMVRTNQPGIIINNRLWLNRRRPAADYQKYWQGDFTTPEQYVPSIPMGSMNWEVCDTLNGSWGWSRCATDYKSADDLLHRMVDTVSRGGNYLLNIGPLPDGSVAPKTEQLMREIGNWMRVNGEAIYGTQAGPFVRLPWGYATLKETVGSWRLYLHVFDWPSDGELAVPGLETVPLKAAMLGNVTKAIRYRKADGRVLISGLPEIPPHPSAGVVVLEFNEKPAAAPHRVHALRDGRFELKPVDAVIERRVSLKDRSSRSPALLQHWRSGSRVSYPLFTEREGTYSIRVTAATRRFDSHNEYFLKVGDQEIPLMLTETEGLNQQRVFEAGRLVLSEGNADLMLSCRAQSQASAMVIYMIELKPQITTTDGGSNAD